MLEVPVDLSALLRTTTTECIREIDTTKLTILLQWMVDCLQRQDEKHRDTKHALEALSEKHQEKSRDVDKQLSDMQKLQVIDRFVWQRAKAERRVQERHTSLIKDREQTESEMQEKLTAVETGKERRLLRQSRWILCRPDVADHTVRVANVEKQFCEEADVRHSDLCKRMGDVEMRLQLVENRTANQEEQNADSTGDNVAVDPLPERIPAQAHQVTELGVKTESEDDHGRLNTMQTFLTRLETRIDNLQNAISVLNKGYDELSLGLAKETAIPENALLVRNQLDLETHSIGKPQNQPRPFSEVHLNLHTNLEKEFLTSYRRRQIKNKTSKRRWIGSRGKTSASSIMYCRTMQ